MKNFLIAAIIALTTIFAGCKQQEPELNFQALEAKYNAQIGVYVLDTNNGREIAYNADDRFAYCSTHTIFSVGALLQRKNFDELNELIKYSAEEILPYSAITKAHVDDGLTVAEICEAALRVSDKTAANLVLEELGGIDAFRDSLRAIGDDVTEPARLELDMNIYTPDGLDDTSTPRQLAKDVQMYLLGDVLSEDKKVLLAYWLSDNSINDELIKPGVPQDWKVLDKNGTGINYGTCNDIGLVCPPNRKPIVVAIMTRRNEESARFDTVIVSDAAKMIYNELQRKF